MTEPLPTARRPFTLLDVMVLVAGCALGFWAASMGFVFNHPWPWSRIGFGFLATVTGMILVGPLVFLRGWLTHRRGPSSPGDWMWLFYWPMGFLLWAMLSTNRALPSDAVIPLRAATAVLNVSVLGCMAAMVFWAVVQASRTRDRPGLGVDRPYQAVVIANAGLWLFHLLFLAFPTLAGISIIVAHIVLWSVVRIAGRRIPVVWGGPPRPWTHWTGLALATGPIVLTILVVPVGEWFWDPFTAFIWAHPYP